MRLQLALSKLGFSSRRKAAELIETGKVKVNGQVIKKPYHKVNIEKDCITVNGKNKDFKKRVYFLMNKPKGVVSTVKDKYAEKKVTDLIKNKSFRIFPAGRLDKDTTGLLLLTNDGELTYYLTHPKFKVEKVYDVKIQGQLSIQQINLLKKGITIDNKKTYPCKIKILNSTEKKTLLRITLTEGRNRQIKKMFKSINYPVISIHRHTLGPLNLGNLKIGQYRQLKNQEVLSLKNSLYKKFN